MHATKECVEQNEGLVVPAPGASSSCAENAASVVACKVIGTGSMGTLKACVLIFESSEAFLKNDVSSVRGCCSAVHSSLIKFRG